MSKKWSHVMLAGVLLCLLSACADKKETPQASSVEKASPQQKSATKTSTQKASSQEKDKTETKPSAKESASSTDKPTESSSAKQPSSASTEKAQGADNPATEPSASTQNTPASYNGSYYAVEGKYGPILIVNKKHPLSPTYGSGENPTASAAFQQLLASMKAEGFAVSDSYSGFRSYETQSNLYQSYAAQDGSAAADRYSARPGYSEHQSGLAFDLLDSSGALLEEPQACQWLSEHAHEYGFIVRYLPGKEAITGYMAESWHIRYIGQEAEDIYRSGLTLEEYFNVPGGDY